MLQTRQADSPRVPPQPSGISLPTLKSNVSHGRAPSGARFKIHACTKDLATSFECLHSSFNISAQFPCNRILHGFSICQNRHRIFSIVNHTCQNIDLASATAVQDSPDPLWSFQPPGRAIALFVQPLLGFPTRPTPCGVEWRSGYQGFPGQN